MRAIGTMSVFLCLSAAACGDGTNNPYLGSFTGRLTVVLQASTGGQTSVLIDDVLLNGTDISSSPAIEGTEVAVEMTGGGGADPDVHCDAFLDTDADVAIIKDVSACDIVSNGPTWNLTDALDAGSVSRADTTLTLTLSGSYRVDNAVEQGTFQLTYTGQFIEGTSP